MTFADAIELKVSKTTDELTEVEGYLIQTVVGEWQSLFDRASAESQRSRSKLEQFVQDKYNTGVRMGERKFREFLSFMSEDIRNQTPYGMTPQLLKSL